MTRPDMTVRGGGIFGLSIAWTATLRGARVRLIETAQIGAGPSGGTVGALCPHTPDMWNAKKAFQLQSLIMAGDWWAGIQSASGLPTGYGQVGRLQPILDDNAMDLARAREISAADLWGDHGRWQVLPATGAPWEPASPTGYLIHDSLSARLHPRLACASLAAAITARGGEIIMGEGENIGPVVWATGVAGLDALSADLGAQVGGAVKGQAITVGYDAGDAAQIFADGLHFVPHSGGTVTIGSTSELTWDHPTRTDDLLDALHARAIALMPVLADAPVLNRWAGLRPRAKSRAPLLGAWPGRAGHFVANGGFRIGFGMAPMVGQVMADLVLNGRDTIPDGFRVADYSSPKPAPH